MRPMCSKTTWIENRDIPPECARVCQFVDHFPQPGCILSVLNTFTSVEVFFSSSEYLFEFVPVCFVLDMILICASLL